MWMAMAWPAPSASPLRKKSMSRAWSRQGVLRQLVLVLAGGDGGGHRLVDHGQQPHHKGVVGGPDDGGVELPVGLRPVLALADAAVHIFPPGQDLGHLLRGGPAAGQPGSGGLKDLPELEEVPQLPPGPGPGGKSRSR